MVKKDFIFSRIPEIHFGVGKFKQLSGIIKNIGSNLLLVTGAASFQKTQRYNDFVCELEKIGVNFHSVTVVGEPTPGFVDEIVEKFRNQNIDVVTSIGGGSAIDAGKAISAMLLHQGSVTQYLEAMENKPHSGVKVPFIAVPTTSGTGAEATKNAVLSVVGASGYKSSLRHDNFVPDVAVVDPELTSSCPKEVTAACGLDAFSQLLEAYVSTNASPMTDALAISGIEHFAAGYRTAITTDSMVEAHVHMAYASLMSGMVLANAGLGLVHGFAGVIGGYFNIPHGVACGTLLAEVNKATIEAMLENKEEYGIALGKFARVAAIMSGMPPTNLEEDCRTLIAILEELVSISGIQKLGYYNIQKSDLAKIVAKTSNKNNPIKLGQRQLETILESRL